MPQNLDKPSSTPLPLLVPLNLLTTLKVVLLFSLPQFPSLSMPSVSRTKTDTIVFMLVIIFIHHLYSIIFCIYEEIYNLKKKYMRYLYLYTYQSICSLCMCLNIYNMHINVNTMYRLSNC